MNIPSTIQIAGHTIPIVWEEMEDALGEWDHEGRRILLHPRIASDRGLLRATLVHEVLHAALCFAGLSCTTSGVLRRKTEEQVVEAIESLAAPVIARIYRY